MNYRRLQGPQHDGLYVDLFVSGVCVKAIIDTGSTISILNPSKYFDISENVRPPLQPSTSDLVIGDGGKVRPLGQVDLVIIVENKRLTHTFVVADVNVPGVLGYDFLKVQKATLDIDRQILKLRDTDVPCYLESRVPSLFRIVLQETVSIPPRSEMFVSGKCLEAGSEVPLLVETSPRLLGKSGVLVARSLLQSDKGEFPLRLMNVSSETKILHKNTTAAVGAVPVSTSSVNQVSSNADKLPEYLQDLYDRSISDLTSDQADKARNFLCKYHDVFASSKQDIGSTTVVRHSINTGDATPIKQRPYRQPYVKREETRKQIKKMLEADIIEPSTSPWASPVVLCKKQDGSWRFALDMRKKMQ